MSATFTAHVVDYDANGYDYRDYWSDRAYEQWAELYALRGIFARTPGPRRWFADFGGAFGRNARHYLGRYEHAVILDYSATNLRNAARLYARRVSEGRLHLIRCDLSAIPFRDLAFDAAMVVRVLHHLSDVDCSLAEMGRTVGGRWIVDVPIKHHLFGLARAVGDGRLLAQADRHPVLVGSAEPYWNFQLPAVRARLRELGWHPALAASVNNFRRWDRLVPAAIADAVRPLVHGLEAVTQVAGRGWWGPSQLVLAQRLDPAYLPDGVRITARPGGVVDDTHELTEPGAAALAARMVCPVCQRGLTWSTVEAYCGGCCAGYRRDGAVWDFVVAHPYVRRADAPVSPAVTAMPPATSSATVGNRHHVQRAQRGATAVPRSAVGAPTRAPHLP